MNINKEQDDNNKNKHVTREELDNLIKEAQASGNWSKVENANVSEIINMSSLFYGAKGIQDLDLSSWDTSSSTTMSYMFSESDFNGLLNFDTSNVTNMFCMFYCNRSCDKILHFDTSNVKSMSSMFENSNYNHPLDFDTSNVESMEDMFKDSKFNQDISNWVIQDTEENQDVIKYRDECIIKRKEREAIEASIENNKKDSFGLKL